MNVESEEALRVEDKKVEPKGLSAEEAESRLKKYGFNEVKKEKESKLKMIIAPFWGPIPWLIEIAAILSAVIQHWEDFVIILFMLFLNASIEFVQKTKASNALDALKSAMALKARVKRDGKWINIFASTLVPGDLINVKNGDIVPADCDLVTGSYLSIDQSVLTGESLPVNKVIGDDAYSGSIVKQGDMDCLITKTGGNTLFGETAQLVQEAKSQSHFQRSVLSVGEFLIIGALLLAVFIISKELYESESIISTIELVLVLIIASIPVAMPAVLSVTMALGALTLSRNKAIVTHLEAIEELAGVEILCTDKTGTLTQNSLTMDKPMLYQAKAEQELFLYAALACKFESDDPIDSLIIDKANPVDLKKFKQTSFQPFDPVSKKTEATIETLNHKTLTVIKGAPQIIIELCTMDTALKKKAFHDVDAYAKKGLRSLGVGKENDKGDFEFLGILSFFDPPRIDSKKVIAEIKTYHIDVKMVTGDDLAIGKQISKQLGLGTHLQTADSIFNESDNINSMPDNVVKKITLSDGFARVFPQHKYGIVKAFQQIGKIVAMTGDGVNDAPALKQANVGIAVSGATDAARAAADLILTAPGLSVITTAIEESRKIFQRMVNYVNYRVAMTINIMLFVTLSILFANITPLTAIMIVMLALLDDIPIMAIAYDNTDIAPKPLIWDMKKVLGVSTILGLVLVIANFVLMACIHQYTQQTFDQIQTIMFLLMVVSGHLLLFVSRHRSWFWLKPWPSMKLCAAIFSTQIVAILICWLGWFVTPIAGKMILFVWIYAIAWMFVLNIFSILFQHRIKGNQ